MRFLKGLGLALALVAVTPSQALIGVATRAGLGGNDQMLWSTAGADLDFLPDGSTATSVGGLGATIAAQATNNVQVLVAGTDWNGGFTDGDFLLFNVEDYLNPPGYLELTFASPVMGVGAQLWKNLGAGTAKIEAFDASDVSLGSYAQSTGGSQAANNNQAAFVGLLSGTHDIKKVRFWGLGANEEQGFAIDELELLWNQQPPPPGTGSIPEPGTLALLGFGGLAVLRRRRRR